MGIEMPSYIKKAQVIDSPIRHSWNDNDPLSYYREDQRFEVRVAKICIRGIVALSLGCAEWIAWRLSKHCTDPVLFHEIEAIWAGIIDWRYMRPLTFPSAPKGDYWRGPERDPVRKAFYGLVEVVDSAKRSKSALSDCSALSQLALHVIPNGKHFRDWRRFVIECLTMFYPRKADDSLGPPMPREVLDPDFNYKPELATELISKFLRSLDHRQNQFLRSPEEMIKDGFEGTPYNFK